MIRYFLLPISCLLLSHWALPADAQPTWAADAVWYQVFPERFRNGDPSNDPTRESLDDPERAPTSWAVTPWTSDWYERAPWEQELGPDFYEDGVFLRRYGGDLQGVIDRLDYLDSLGVTAIYFNPVFHAPSLHKYDAASMHHIDPHFGPDPAGDLSQAAGETEDPASWGWTSADSLFLRLLSEAHEREIRVVIDGVFNHTGTRFFAFDDLRRLRGSSRYRDWYVVTREDDPSTAADEFDWQGWWDYRGLPVFADEPADQVRGRLGGEDLAEGPKAYVMAITRRWMDPNGDGDPSDGVDGWRLDVAEEVPVGFWKDWHELVRSINSEALTVAEIWSDPRDFMARAGFDVAMNYHGLAIPLHDFLVDGRMGARALVDTVAVRAGRLTTSQGPAMLNLVDSHDTDRIASMLMNPDGANYDRDNGARVSAAYDMGAPDERARDLHRVALVLQATMPGAAMVYYGDEAGAWGGDDPDDRKPMIWPDLDFVPETHDPRGRPRRADSVAFDHSLFAFYREALALRGQLPALRHGAMHALVADDATRTFAFSRSLGDELVVVLVNAGDADSALDLSGPDGLIPLIPIFASRGDVADVPSLVMTFHDDGTTTYRNPVRARTAVVFRRARGEDVRPGGLEE